MNQIEDVRDIILLSKNKKIKQRKIYVVDVCFRQKLKIAVTMPRARVLCGIRLLGPSVAQKFLQE